MPAALVERWRPIYTVRLMTPTSYMLLLLLLPLLIEPMALVWRAWIYGSASRCRRPRGRQWSLPPQPVARLPLDIERRDAARARAHAADQ